MSMSSLGSREFESCWGKLPDDFRRLRSHCWLMSEVNRCGKSLSLSHVRVRRVASAVANAPGRSQHNLIVLENSTDLLTTLLDFMHYAGVSCRVNLWMTLGRGEWMKRVGTHSLDFFHRQATSKRAGDWWSPPYVWALSVPCSHSLEWSSPKSAGVKGSKPGLPVWRVWPLF